MFLILFPLTHCLFSAKLLLRKRNIGVYTSKLRLQLLDFLLVRDNKLILFIDLVVNAVYLHHHDLLMVLTNLFTAACQISPVLPDLANIRHDIVECMDKLDALSILHLLGNPYIFQFILSPSYSILLPSELLCILIFSICGCFNFLVHPVQGHSQSVKAAV